MPQMTIAEALAHASHFQRAGRLKEAESIYRQILAFAPHHTTALAMLGYVASLAGDPNRGLGLVQRAIEIGPATVTQYTVLGLILHGVGRLDEAVNAYRTALSLDPNSPEVHTNLGVVLADQRKLQEATASYRRAIELRPTFPEAYNNLCIALKELGRTDEAIDAGRQAIAQNENYPEAHNSLGLAYQQKGDLDAAISSFGRAIALRPDFAEMHANLAIALRLRGDVGGAIASTRVALAIKPSSAWGSDLLFLLHSDPASTRESLAREHADWNQKYAQPLAHRIVPPVSDRSPNRKLRVGYVCPNLTFHPMLRFISPLLEHYNPSQFQVVCYARAGVQKSLVQRLGDRVHSWRDVARFSTEQIAQSVREDRIDILVDLVMHTDSEALLAFALKPAPVQVTYLAYCSTTGLQTIDYRFTDRFFDPSEQNDRFYSERSIRLTSYWCYEPSPLAGPVEECPAAKKGFITFGCLNNLAKVSTPALETWRDVLRLVPESMLILHAHEGTYRNQVQDYLQAGGVDPRRVQFAGFVPAAEYLRQYGNIDIALDTFPFTGGTTTCDALWMGVPVVSLAGQTAVSRGGLSILSTIGHPELVANSKAQYVQIACKLAGDVSGLIDLRATLRDQMRSSPLMDAPAAAREIEAAYLRMWRAWCDQKR